MVPFLSRAWVPGSFLFDDFGTRAGQFWGCRPQQHTDSDICGLRRVFRAGQCFSRDDGAPAGKAVNS